MIRSFAGGAAIIAATSLATCAVAADGFYVSGSLGAAFREPLDSVLTSFTDPFGNRVIQGGAFVPYKEAERERFDTGLDVGAAAGYSFDLGARGALRTELEFDYRQSALGSVTVNSLPSPVFKTVYHAFGTPIRGGEDETFSGTANLFYDFTRFSSFTPYVGAGVGYERGLLTSSTRLRKTTITDAVGTFSNQNTVNAAGSHGEDGTYLAEAGVAIPLLKSLSLVPAYRFVQRFNGQAPTHLLKLGLRYSF